MCQKPLKKGNFIKNASAFLPRRAGCEAPSYLRGCDPPEALISDAGLQPMSEPNFTMRIHLMIEITRILRQRLKIFNFLSLSSHIIGV